MEKQLFGYAGSILRINLTHKAISKEPLPDDLIKDFIGGRGFNMKILYDEVLPGIDPLGPENKLIISVGPCAGTTVPGSQRFNMAAKSPLTGFLCDSDSAGDFGAALKYAGYDTVIVEGQSEKPVYLFFNDKQPEIRDASHLWGKTVFETRRAIEKELNDPEVCCASIGPAGENLVRFAAVISELGRASGRSGIGAVFGSKKIKAIVARGNSGVKVANYEMLKQLNKQNYEEWEADPEAYTSRAKYGPTRSWGAYSVRGMLPTNNFQRGTFEKDMFADLVNNKHIVKQKACFSCPLGCNHSYRVIKGPYAGIIGEGLELDPLGDYGPKVGNDDIALALKASSMVNDLGMDIMDSSAMIAFAMECYENGILTKADTDGLDLSWGNPEAILSLIKMMTYGQGLGKILAQGAIKASQIIGHNSEQYAMHVKGQTLVMRNVRASKSWALMYATSSRGACHMRAWVPEGYGAGGSETPRVWDPDVLKLVSGYSDPLNPYKEEGKAEMVKWYEDLRALRDSLDICHFSVYRLAVDAKNESTPGIYAKLLNAVTGSSLTALDAMLVGERIYNVEKAFNLREGLTRKDDSLPKRMLEEPLPDGPAKGQVVALDQMLDRYYEVRGWDKQTGFPTRKKLLELGLAKIAADLEKIDRIS